MLSHPRYESVGRPRDSPERPEGANESAGLHEHEGWTARYQDVPDPAIGPADVLVRVRACALNHLISSCGKPSGIPAAPALLTGCDIAGEVAQVGAAVREVAVGDRVAVNPNLHCGRCEFCQKGEQSLCVTYGILGEHVHGGLAEYVKVAGDKTLTLPAHVKYEDAAAFILVNMTAWRMLVTQARVRAGEDLLVIGVGGGVSSTAVQIGKLCGARVWVTSSS
jgi:NADPH:quinone reductase-like Zn-dependent oxidoreductase